MVHCRVTSVKKNKFATSKEFTFSEAESSLVPCWCAFKIHAHRAGGKVGNLCVLAIIADLHFSLSQENMLHLITQSLVLPSSNKTAETFPFPACEHCEMLLLLEILLPHRLSFGSKMLATVLLRSCAWKTAVQCCCDF